MHTLSGSPVLSGKIFWNQFNHPSWESEVGLTIQFPLIGKLDERQAVRIVTEAIQKNSIAWIKPNRGHWQIDTDQLRSWLDDGKQTKFIEDLDWLYGVVTG